MTSKCFSIDAIDDFKPSEESLAFPSVSISPKRDKHFLSLSWDTTE